MTEPVENPLGIFTMTASGSVTGKRFVKYSGAQCDTAGEDAAGIAMHDADDGDPLAVAPMGTCLVTGGSAMSTIGTQVATNADGKAITAVNPHIIQGVTLSVCSGDGDEILIALGAGKPVKP